ncbi:MAG TPA: glycosyltransferase family 4 protein [Chthoniobacter sp.]
MRCQLAHGLNVHGISPADDTIPAERQQSIGDLPITEFDRGRSAELDLVLPSLDGGQAGAVLHFHGIAPWMDRMAKVLRKRGIPYVFTSHGHLHYHGWSHGLKKWIYLNFVDRFLRGASGLHFLSEREKERSRAILPWGRKSVLVQSNLIQLPDEAEITPADRADLDIPADAFIFAYLGRLDVEHKGLDILLKAFSLLSHGRGDRKPDQLPDSFPHLLMIGPDWAGGQARLEELARQLDQSSRVHFLGPRMGEAKWSLLKMAGAFVSPSRWEACSISQAEAIGLGLPTIVSDEINMAPEMVAAHAALASPLTTDRLAAAMRQVQADGDLQRTLSESGRKWAAETCSAEKAGERFAKFYRAVLG